MIQEIGVFILFGVALFYLLRTFFASVPSGDNDSPCGTACKGCGAVDFKSLEKKMEKDRKLQKATAEA
ncbi:hypothetical protein AB9P05_07315 [Roseivirga sp. BDSF3-8]|uniref:hypothetical protein n=1 Tax=Roseivirga sp. BDSF3-8 TaxID=3241598 RepID=UPI0035321BD1